MKTFTLASRLHEIIDVHDSTCVCCIARPPFFQSKSGVQKREFGFLKKVFLPFNVTASMSVATWSVELKSMIVQQQVTLDGYGWALKGHMASLWLNV